MPADKLAELREEVATANRILAHEGVVDAFGHVSARHPTDPNRYLISRYQACELVQPEDVLEFTLDSKPVVPTDARLYSEMVIHGCIYQARPDVQAVCHHHAPAVLPFCITGVELVPVYHLGASLGGKVPFWDSRDEFGDTALVVTKPEEGHSLARALGEQWIVLMRRHGATVVGRNLRDCVFRSIYTTRNAELQARAMAMGPIGPLSAGELAKCGGHNLSPRTNSRAWEYWNVRLQKVEGTFKGKRRQPKAGKAAAAKRSAGRGKAKTRSPASRNKKRRSKS